jgi:dihydrofolate synthase/folylpolyglutamate synthase
MTYAEAIAYLESLTDFERLGFHHGFAETVNLDAARQFMRLLGDPHQGVPAIHIAGTKGKGSTAALLDSVLRAAGYRTGLFTSPHLVSFRERVRVSGQMLPEADIARLVERVRPAVEAVRGMPGLSPCTFFETYLGMAALHFAAQNVDLAIYETGLGGRLDATNLVTPRVAAITTIGFDHMAVLGDTLDAIAREKAGIAKAGVPLVVATGQPEEAWEAICEVAGQAGAPVVQAPGVERAEPPTRAAVAADGTPVPPTDRFVAEGWGEPLECALLGAHQASNVGVALGVLEQLRAAGYTVGDPAVAEGLARVRWPGRFDLRGARPWVVFDCAHNAESARALARALPEYLDYRRLALVVGMSEDKDAGAFAAELARLGAQAILTQAGNARAAEPAVLAERAGGLWDDARQVPDVLAAYEAALESAGEDGAVCVTGSFYVVGEAMVRLGVEA